MLEQGNQLPRCRDVSWRFLAASLGVLLIACGPAGVIRERKDGQVGGDAASGPDGAPGLDATLDGSAPGQDAGLGGDAAVLHCDPGFAFVPDPGETGQILEVSYTTTAQGYAYVGLRVEGPTPSVVSEQTGVTLVSGQSPWSWMWYTALHGGGIWTFTFTAGQPSADIASCQADIADTGAPPALPVLPGDCSNKVCGQDDGNGGTCERCPMVASEGGLCMDPPSPIGPSGPGPWACLDNAGCELWGPVCRIWCPGEPCRLDLHPDGCPQGVETCYVDPNLTDYEEACRQCCNSRYHEPLGLYACWDDNYNICRHPYDCGNPYPQP